jgi:hypothetical protein
MALTELEQKAVQELERDLGERIEREQKGLEDTQFRWTKLQIRVRLFGEQDLDDQELESWNQVYPTDIAKHQAEIARLNRQLEQLRAYAASSDGVA